MSFWGQLKRRKMVQVAAVYAVVAWLLVQIVVAIKAPLNLPGWMDTFVIVCLGIGFPITLIISWAFDVTPEGLVRDSGTRAPSGGRTIEYVLIGLLLVAVGWLSYRLELVTPTPTTASAASSAVPVAPAPSASPSADASRLPNSVAVLPFASLSLDPNNEFFAEGIHDELLNQLSKISGLNVIARTSVLRYAKTEKSVAEIADELNVATIMEGTIRYGNKRIRLTAQLIDPDTGTHLWSHTYDSAFDVNNVFDIESDIATNIADELQAKLSPSEQASLGTPLTHSTEAWARYLQAMELMNFDLNPWLSPEEVKRFHALLDEAIEIDPNFATAHAVKAVQYAFYMSTPKPISDRSTPADWEQAATKEAERALKIEPTTGLAYMALGIASWIHNQGARAHDAFERALELDPTNIDILDDFARLTAHMGRREEALPRIRRLAELKPHHVTLAYLLFTVGRLDEAATEFSAFLASNAFNSDDAVNFALVQMARGDLAAARKYVELSDALEAERSESPLAGTNLARRAYIYGRIGDPERARGQYERLRSLASRLQVNDVTWALASLAVGDRTAALEHLEAAAGNSYRDVGLVDDLIVHNATRDPVLEQPEFVEVRKRLQLR